MFESVKLTKKNLIKKHSILFIYEQIVSENEEIFLVVKKPQPAETAQKNETER